MFKKKKVIIVTILYFPPWRRYTSPKPMITLTGWDCSPNTVWEALACA